MSVEKDPSKKQIALQFVYLAVSLLGSGLLMKWATSQLDPQRAEKKKALLFKRALQRRLGRNISTDSHEDTIALDVINPANINVTLDGVGGLQESKDILNMKVIMPLKMPGLFDSYLLRQAKGVLLYGPPGTGKTMLAKALAKEAGACFINIKASSLQSKWFGETQKLVHALFSLAYKLQPCIIFIDEVDSLLGRRREQEHEATTTMKTEFMQLWDGFNTDSTANVMILAATNRPYELDEAVLRRFSLQLEIPMPNASQREAILGIILREHAVTQSSGPGISLDLLENRAEAEGRRPQARIAEQTDGFSGSDLLELCKRAATLPIKECIDRKVAEQRSQAAESSQSSRAPRLDRPRDVRLSDFIQVLGSFQPSTHAAEAYRSQVSSQDRRPDSDQARVWLRQTLAELQLQNLSLLMHMSSRPQ